VLRNFRESRREGNLSQSELLKKELKLIGLALLVIVALFGALYYVSEVLLR
jgi:hypothetical protein